MSQAQAADPLPSWNEGGTKATVTTQLVDCIAQALENNADQADLKKYVNGQMDLNDIGGAGKGSADSAQSEAENCAKTAVASDSA